MTDPVSGLDRALSFALDVVYQAPAEPSEAELHDDVATALDEGANDE